MIQKSCTKQTPSGNHATQSKRFARLNWNKPTANVVEAESLSCPICDTRRESSPRRSESRLVMAMSTTYETFIKRTFLLRSGLFFYKQILHLKSTLTTSIEHHSVRFWQNAPTILAAIPADNAQNNRNCVKQSPHFNQYSSNSHSRRFIIRRHLLYTFVRNTNVSQSARNVPPAAKNYTPKIPRQKNSRLKFK